MKSFSPISASYNPFELLRVYTFYRTLLGIVLLIMFKGNLAPKVLGIDNPDIFLFASIGYTVFNVSTLLLLWQVRFSPSQKQLFALFLIEIAAVILLMHSSGGASNAFNMHEAINVWENILEIRETIFIIAIYSCAGSACTRNMVTMMIILTTAQRFLI